jgi:CRP/FNR family cyclic AMP-dependent transcriptional regulator
MIVKGMLGLDKFIRSFPLKKFSRGEIIIQQEESPRWVGVVKSGIVKCYDISLEGTEQLIWLAAEGDAFPLAYLFEDAQVSSFFYSAFSDVELYAVDRAKFVNFLKKDAESLFKICAVITRRFSDLHFRVNAAGKPKAKEKIMHTLAFLADRYYDKKRGGKVEVALPLTHQDIANLVGLTRETAAVILKSLKDEGFVHYDQSSFVIYRQKIEETLW